MGKFFDKIKDTVQDAGKSISNAVQDVRTLSASEIAQNLKNEADKAKDDAIKNIKDTTSDAGKSIKDQFSDAGKNIKETSKDALKSTEDLYKEVKDKIGDKLGGGVGLHALNKYNPAFIAMRGSVLAVLNTNIVGMAKAMSLVREGKGNEYNEIKQKWWLWGGEKEKFDQAVSNGKNKPELFKDLVEKYSKRKSGFNGYSNISGQKADTAGNIVITSASLLGVASGVLLAVPEPTSATKIAATATGSAAAAFGAIGGLLKSFAAKNGGEDYGDIPKGDNLPTSNIPSDRSDLLKINEEIDNYNKIFGINKTYFWIGTSVFILAIAGMITYKFIKK